MGVWGDIVYSRNVFLDDIKKLLQDSQVLDMFTKSREGKI